MVTVKTIRLNAATTRAQRDLVVASVSIRAIEDHLFLWSRVGVVYVLGRARRRKTIKCFLLYTSVFFYIPYILTHARCLRMYVLVAAVIKIITWIRLCVCCVRLCGARHTELFKMCTIYACKRMRVLKVQHIRLHSGLSAIIVDCIVLGICHVVYIFIYCEAPVNLNRSAISSISVLGIHSNVYRLYTLHSIQRVCVCLSFKHIWLNWKWIVSAKLFQPNRRAIGWTNLTQQ